MKKVLFILYYFPPMGGSGVQRPLKFLKYLPMYGWEPTVICPEIGSYAYVDKGFSEQGWFQSLRVLRVKNETPFKYNWMQKLVQSTEQIKKPLRRISDLLYVPDNKRAWRHQAIQKATELLLNESFDLIFSSAPPFSNLLAAKDLSQTFNLPLIIDFRDAWTESHLERYPTLWHKTQNQKLEQQVVDSATAVTAINSFILHSVSRNSNHKAHSLKKEIIPHGFDEEDFELANYLKPDSRLLDANALYLIHNGLFYSERRPDELLKAFKSSLEYPTIKKPKLVLQGGLEEKHHHLIASLGLNEHVIDLGYQSHIQAVRNAMQCQASILLIGHKKRSEQIVTGKLSEYIGLGKPIIGLVPNGAAKEILTESDAYFIADPYRIDEIASAIVSFYKSAEQNASKVISDDFKKRFSRKTQSKQLAELFNQCLN